jgi:Major Facilitator Superfamily.
LNSINIIFIIFILAVIPIILLKEKERIDVTDTKLNESIKQGLRFILNEKLLKEMLLLGFIVNFLFGAMALLLISLIQLKLNLSPLFVSMVFLMLIGGISAGSYFGKFIGGKLSFMIFLTMVSSSIVFMITSFLKNIYLIGILVLAGGFIIGITNVFFSYTLLKKIPRDLIARIMGAFNTFGLSATAMSGVVAGTIIQIVGVRYSLLIIGSVLLVISPLAIIFKELREVNVPKRGK